MLPSIHPKMWLKVTGLPFQLKNYRHTMLEYYFLGTGHTLKYHSPGTLWGVGGGGGEGGERSRGKVTNFWAQ